MANVKITELTAATTLDGDDVFPVVDVSGDTTNKVSVTDLLRNAPDGTAAAPSIANTGDQDTGILFPAADTVAISTGGTQRFSVDGSGDVSISGSLTVSGTTTTIESTTLTVDDKNIELGTVATPSDTTADGGGITLKGATDKTINWVQSTGCWTFNQPMNFNDHVRIDSSGNVGIGTTSAGARLHVEEASPTDGILLKLNNDVNSSGSEAGLRIRHNDTSLIECNLLTERTGLNAGLDFKIELSNSSGTVTERLRIDEDGNLGVGTANPSANLHVRRGDGDPTELKLTNSEGTYKLSANANSGTYDTNNHIFRNSTGSTEYARIDSSGNVGIGTSSASRTLHVNSGATNEVARFESSDTEVTVEFKDTTGTASLKCRNDYRFNNSSGELVRIDSSGNLGIGTTSPTGYIHIEGASTGTETYGRFTTGSANGDQSLVIKSGSSRDHMAIQVSTNAGANDDLSLQPDGGNVGIGTSSPSELLHCVSTGDSDVAFFERGDASGTARIKIQSGDGSFGTINAPDGGNTLAFFTGTSERLRIDSSGRLLVGTTADKSISSDANALVQIFTSSAGKLLIGRSDASVVANDHLGIIDFHTFDGGSQRGARIAARADGDHASGDVPSRIEFSTCADSSSTLTERMRIDSSGNAIFKNSSYVSFNDNGYIRTDSSGYLRLQMGSNGTMFTNSGNVEVARIDTSGRVGIGDTAPSEKLNVAGNVMLEGGDQYLYLTNVGTGNSGIYIRGNTSGSYLRSHSTGSFTWEVTGSEKMRIDSSGNVGIGTSSPGYKIEVTEGSSNSVARFTGANSANLVFRNATSNVFELNAGGGNDELSFGTGGNNERMRIDSSGQVGVGLTPGVKFDVDVTNSAFRVKSDTTAAQILITSDDNASAKIEFGDESDNDRGAITYDNPNNALIFQANASERMRIDSGGNMGLGTTSPSTRLEVVGNTTPQLKVGMANDADRASLMHNGSNLYLDTTAGALIFRTASSTERMRIDSSGRVGVGGTPLTSALLYLEDASYPALKMSYGGSNGVHSIGWDSAGLSLNADEGNDAGSSKITFGVDSTERMRIDSSGNVGIGIAPTTHKLHIHMGDSSSNLIHFTNTTTGSTAGDGALIGLDGNESLLISQKENNHIGVHTNNTERLRIDGSGNAGFGTTSPSTNNYDVNGASSVIIKAGNTTKLQVATVGATPITANRDGDGNLISFFESGAFEGNISVSGTTVSYNGAHLARWSQLPGGAERTEILRGSVLSNLDEMCEWGEEDNEQLNRMKVSDVEGDRNVSGVFQAWDDDDDTYTNDFYCAMTGDFVIRIAQGTTVARGDLLMSAGDGTAKPQDDDIVRSKTIAKVTSTTVSATYADGSYCVPCVLMAC